jgi:hypothetical protein
MLLRWKLPSKFRKRRLLPRNEAFSHTVTSLSFLALHMTLLLLARPFRGEDFKMALGMGVESQIVGPQICFRSSFEIAPLFGEEELSTIMVMPHWWGATSRTTALRWVRLFL